MKNIFTIINNLKGNTALWYDIISINNIIIGCRVILLKVTIGQIGTLLKLFTPFVH